MKKKIKSMAAVIVTAVTLLAVPAFAGSWQADCYGWWYLNDDGSYPVNSWLYDNGSWYYMDSYGIMQTGWVWDGFNWYYMNPSGAMATGWIYDGNDWYYLDLYTGVMATGWIWGDGAWYYLNPYTGAMATGWVYDNGSWYYLSPYTGAMVTGWVLDGVWYYLSESGAMVTCWELIDDTWYYFDESGALIDPSEPSGEFGTEYQDSLPIDAVNIRQDNDFIVGDSMPGDLVSCTVHFVDAVTGKELADPVTYYGYAGDVLVIAYEYIEGYRPQYLQITERLQEESNDWYFPYLRLGEPEE